MYTLLNMTDRSTDKPQTLVLNIGLIIFRIRIVKFRNYEIPVIVTVTIKIFSNIMQFYHASASSEFPVFVP